MMLRGISARGWYVIALAASAGWIIYICVAITLYWFDTNVDFTANPVAAWSVAGGIGIFAVLVPTARGLAMAKTRRELRAGYTTLPYLRDVDLRDPRDGRILRRQGDYVMDERFTLSFKRARFQAGPAASTTTDHHSRKLAGE